MNRAVFFVCLLSAIANSFTCASEPLHERIDSLVLSQAKSPSAEVADDAEFLRRIYLDFSGVIPSAETVRSFLADPSVDKRQQLIDRLLNDPSYAPTMRDRFHVHLMERRGDNDLWLAWLEDSFRQNKPWDQMTREIVRADFRDEPNRGAAFFYAKRLEKSGQNPTDYSGLTRDVGRLFLGMDLQCAECHNHLLIKDYDQIDFQGMMAGFAKLKLLRLDYPAVEEQLMKAKHEYASVFTGIPREVGPRIPGLGEIELVTFESGEEYLQTPDRKSKTPGVPKFSPLAEFSAQIGSAPTFSPNIANRVWFLMMGRGLVEPLDQFHSRNPASHPELLDLVARELAANKYDLKWLFRELALSQTYQRSTQLPPGAPRPSADEFVVGIERRVSAEQLLASTLRAIGVKPAVEQLADLEKRFHDAFANDAKDPEESFAPGMKGALFAMNDPEIANLIRHEDALPAKLAAGTDSDSRIVEEIFLILFSRMPTDEERGDVIHYINQFTGTKHEAIVDVVWAMLTSTEFVVNH